MFIYQIKQNTNVTSEKDDGLYFLRGKWNSQKTCVCRVLALVTFFGLHNHQKKHKHVRILVAIFTYFSHLRIAYGLAFKRLKSWETTYSVGLLQTLPPLSQTN